MKTNNFINKQGVTLNGNKLEGYAVVFYDGSSDTEYRMSGNVVERVSPNCKITFVPNVICDGDHDTRNYLGGTKPNTLQLKTDNKGVFYSCDLPNTTAGNDYRSLAERGDIIGSSFKFTPSLSKYKISREGSDIVQTFVTLNIERVSPVYNPAYEGAVRSKDDEVELTDNITKFEETEKMLAEADRYK